MATNFPTSLDSLTNPTSSDSLNSPSHSAQHANVNDAVEALQAKVGVDSSAVSSSLDYKVAQLEAISHGKILQIQTTTVTTGFATTSTSFVDVTGVSVSITPTSASNNVLVMVQGFGGNNTNNIAKVNLLRDATNIAQSTGSGISDQTLAFSTTSDRDTAPIGITYLDSPATTSAVTYKIQLASTQAATTVAIGRRAVDGNWQGVTTITAIEVSA